MRLARELQLSRKSDGIEIYVKEEGGAVYAAKIAFPEIQRPLKKILLDPGHSTKIPGARSTDGTAKEEALNLLQAEIIAKELMGKAKVDIFDPDSDELAEIAQYAAGYDFFISLHMNSYAGSADPGTEVWVAPFAKKASKELAARLSKEISEELETTNRGVKEGNFYVLRNSEPLVSGPCVLVESFFLNKYNERTAKALAERAAYSIAEVLFEMVS